MHERVRLLNAAPVRTTRARYVLYWMQMNRRATHTQALEFAAQLAKDRDLPLVCYEGLDGSAAQEALLRARLSRATRNYVARRVSRSRAHLAVGAAEPPFL